MAGRVPGMIDGSDGIAREKAYTEVLAQAFDRAAGDYFERQAEYESAIGAAKEDRDTAKQYAIIGVAVGLVIAVAGLLIDQIGLAALGLVIAGAVGWYQYSQYTAAIQRIEENQRNIQQNQPDGEVSFVSQISVPTYLVQYSDRHMIFDGNNTAPTTNLELTLVDGDELASAESDLQEVADIFETHLSDEKVLDPELAEQFSPKVTEHRQLEKPITDQIDQMTTVMQDVERTSIDVNIHANNGTAQSIHQLYGDDLVHSNGDIPTIETSLSMSESEQIINEIRGVEVQAVSGNMLNQVENRRETVNEISDSLAQRLSENVETTADHFAEHAEIIEDSTRKFVCTQCLDERIDRLDDELNLVAEILSVETGSFGVALSDPDLDDIPVDGDLVFTEQVKNDIRDELPILRQELKEAYNTLPDLGRDGDYCTKHERVQTVPVERDGRLFSEVWRSLYYRFRDPIMDSVEDLEREAEEIRQNKEQKMIDLAQYEQIKDAAERDYHSVKAEHETAAEITRRL